MVPETTIRTKDLMTMILCSSLIQVVIMPLIIGGTSIHSISTMLPFTFGAIATLLILVLVANQSSRNDDSKVQKQQVMRNEVDETEHSIIHPDDSFHDIYDLGVKVRMNDTILSQQTVSHLI